MKVSAAVPTAAPLEAASVRAEMSSPGAGWVEAFDRAVGSVTRARSGATAADDRLKQLSEMIRLQMDVCRHQVQVELVSKVAESGVASVRKLQQPQ